IWIFRRSCMDRLIYDKNIDALDVYDKGEVLLKLEECNTEHVIYEDGVLRYIDGGELYLTSRYDKEMYARIFAKQYKDAGHFANIYVMGFGDGTYIRELLKLDVSYVIVYEPSYEIFKTVAEKVDITDILKDERFHIVFPSRDDMIYLKYLESSVTLANMNLNVFTHLPNYHTIFLDNWKSITRLYITAVERVAFDRNTEYAMSMEILENILELLPDAVNQYSASDLVDVIKEHVGESDAAILVAAGPSLDKNVDLLKDVKGRIPILAVDTALKTLVRRGIMPDFTITLDPHKPLVLFEDERIKDIPMIVYTCSNKSVVKVHNGKRFYFVHDMRYLSDIYKKYDKVSYGINTGGSVACNAFSFLLTAGFSKIILMGQDLAYPNNKEHASDAYDGKEKPVDENKKKYFYVDSVDGDKVLTEFNMNMYRKWFESQISLYNDDITVYDATEGGALIHGTEVVKLSDVLEKYKDEKLDITELIDGVDKAFTDEQIAEIVKMIDDIPDDLEERRKKLEDGIKAYEGIEKAYVKKKTFGKAFERDMKTVKEVNEFVDADSLCNLVKAYNILESIDLSQSIYEYDSNATQYSQIKEIVDKGISIFKAYIRSIGVFEKDYVKLKDNLKNYEMLTDRIKK
ncbi:MAG TPA: hypothetical protein DCX21_01890, partial [Eubacterium sp.]|nr:hypothetical protein [Eubacterium sp.]